MDLIKLQELMLERNLVIRALPKEVEHKFIYYSPRKDEYDGILKTNSTARIEVNKNGVEYIVYRENTKYQEDSFIVGIKNNTSSCVDSWEWLVDDSKKVVIFNSLNDIIKYFSELNK